MFKKKFSIVLTVILLGGVSLWYVFIYHPKKIEIDDIKLKISKIRSDIVTANKANFDINNIEIKLEEEKKRLEDIQTRFVEKDDLAKVSKEMKNFARKHELRLTDFAPVFEDYFADTINTQIKALPLTIKVKGRYLKVGEFVENWKKLPFYLQPTEIAIQRFQPTRNDVEAIISSKLYSWNHKKEGL